MTGLSPMCEPIFLAAFARISVTQIQQRNRSFDLVPLIRLYVEDGQIANWAAPSYLEHCDTPSDFSDWP